MQASKVGVAGGPLQSLEAGILGLSQQCKRFCFLLEKSINTRSVIQDAGIFGPQGNGYLQFPNCLSLLFEESVAVGKQDSCANVFGDQFELPLQSLKKLTAEAQRQFGLPQALQRIHERKIDVVVVTAQLHGPLGDGSGFLQAVQSKVREPQDPIGAFAISLTLDRLARVFNRLVVSLLCPEELGACRQCLGELW